jgi:hypothetical protein
VSSGNDSTCASSTLGGKIDGGVVKDLLELREQPSVSGRVWRRAANMSESHGDRNMEGLGAVPGGR